MDTEVLLKELPYYVSFGCAAVGAITLVCVGHERKDHTMTTLGTTLSYMVIIVLLYATSG